MSVTPTPRSIAAHQEACAKKFEAHKLSHLFLAACELERELTAERAARERAEAERDALAEALRFYADPDVYKTHRHGGPEDPLDYVCPIGEDEGQIARAALAALERGDGGKDSE